MIIPPDPEKDPNLFDPSASTPSLLPPSDESEIRHPDAALIRNPFSGYGDDDWSGEQLPPYERRRVSSIRRSRTEEPGSVEDHIGNTSMRQTSLQPVTIPVLTSGSIPSRSRSHPVLHIPQSSSSHPSSSVYPSNPLSSTLRPSSASLPSLVSPSTTVHADPSSSSSKLWETSTKESGSSRRKKRRHVGGVLLPVSPKVKDFWQKWKKWIIAISIVLVLGLGTMIGLLVKLKSSAFGDETPPSEKTYSPWHDIDGKQAITEWPPDGSLNLTYTPARDGPASNEGVASNCNNFTPMNTTDFTLLAIPYPASSQSVQTLYFPVNTTANRINLWDEFFINSRGLGSSGTIYFVGRDAPDEVINGGQEDLIRVDIVSRYSGMQNLKTVVQVCQMDKMDGSSGIGIYTPIQTDGKVTNVYMLDPTQLPSFQILVRFPPSLVYGTGLPIHIPSLRLSLDRMNVVFGDLRSIVEFGNVNVTTGRGGVAASYLYGDKVSVMAGYNDVKGTWNISNSLSINVTEASINADVILFNPSSNSTNGTSSTSSSLSSAPSSYAPASSSPTASASKVYKRAPTPGPSEASIFNPRPVFITNNPTTFQNAMFQAGTNATPVNTINTMFASTSGSININYISHPPRTALSAFVMAAQGGVNLCLNPNYVGPFAVRNVWGEVRLPPPSYKFHSDNLIDPLGLNRFRGISTGLINVPDNSLFAKGGVNATNLPYSGTTISGAAYWYFDPSRDKTKPFKWQYGSGAAGSLGQENSTQLNEDGDDNENGNQTVQAGTFNATITTRITPQDVQASQEGKGSEVMVLGAWGDVQITFDGSS